MREKTIAELEEKLIKSGDNILDPDTHNKFLVALQENFDWLLQAITNIRTQLGLPELITSDTQPSYSTYTSNPKWIFDGLELKEAIEKLDYVLWQINNLLQIGSAGYEELETLIPPSTLSSLQNFVLYGPTEDDIRGMSMIQMLDGTILLSYGTADNTTYCLRIDPTFKITGHFTVSSDGYIEVQDALMQAIDQWGVVIQAIQPASGNDVTLYASYAKNLLQDSPNTWSIIGTVTFSGNAEHLGLCRRYKSSTEYDMVLTGRVTNTHEIYHSTDIGNDWDECWNTWSLASNKISDSAVGNPCEGFDHNLIYVTAPANQLNIYKYSNFDLSDDPPASSSITGLDHDAGKVVKVLRAPLPHHFIVAVEDTDGEIHLYTSSDDLQTVHLADTITLDDTTWDSWAIVQLSNTQVALAYKVNDRTIYMQTYLWTPI